MSGLKVPVDELPVESNPTPREAVGEGRPFICPGCGELAKVPERDQGLDPEETVESIKMTCDCGWSKKFYGDSVDNHIGANT